MCSHDIIADQDKVLSNLKQNELEWLERNRIEGKITTKAYIKYKKQVEKWKE